MPLQNSNFIEELWSPPPNNLQRYYQQETQLYQLQKIVENPPQPLRRSWHLNGYEFNNLQHLEQVLRLPTNSWVSQGRHKYIIYSNNLFTRTQKQK